MKSFPELAILSDEISLDLEEAFRYGEEFGFKKYEIRCFDDYEHRIPNFRPGVMERLEELVDSGVIDVTAVTPGTFTGGVALVALETRVHETRNSNMGRLVIRLRLVTLEAVKLAARLAVHMAFIAANFGVKSHVSDREPNVSFRRH